MLLIVLIALWTWSIVAFFLYAHIENKDGLERIEMESILCLASAILILGSSPTVYVVLEVLRVVNSEAFRIISLICGFMVLESITFLIILIFEIVAWAIRKLICNIILRIYCVEIPKSDSKYNVFMVNLTDDSIMETLNFCKVVDNESDTFGENLEFEECVTFLFPETSD